MKSLTLKSMVVGLVLAAPATAGFYYAMSSNSGLAPERMRAELARGIVEQWGPYVERKYKIDADDWAARMEPTFKKAEIQNVENAASAQSFDAMTLALMGSPSPSARGNVSPKALGNAGTDLVYTPIVPCRVVDTRLSEGRLAARQTRSYKATTTTDFVTQGGAASNCGIPLNASVVVAKVTATRVQLPGYLTIYPSNESQPLAAALNYEPNEDTGNEVHVKLCRPGCVEQFSVFTYEAVDVVVDINGYFMEPEATALDCTVATQSGNLDLLASLQTRQVQCPSGYTATGGGCGGPLGIAVSNSKPSVSGGRPSGWQCDLVGSLLSVVAYEVNATCCRTPGR